MKTRTILKNLSIIVLPLAFDLTLSAESKTSAEPARLGITITTEGTGSGETRLKVGDTSYKHVEINNSSWVLGKSLKLDNGSLTINLAYHRTDINEGNYHHFERDYSADRVPLPNELQSLTASIDCSTRINSSWSLSSSIGTGSHVAKHDLLSKGWGTSGHVMGLYTWSPSLNIAVGFAYDSLSEDWKCVPILGVEWRPADKWTVAFGFPKTAVSYEFSKKFTMSLAASGAGGTYFIGEDPRPGTAPHSLANSKLEYAEIRLGFETAWKINDTFSLSGSVGGVLYREFKYIDRNYKLRSRDVVPFFSLAVSASL